MSKAHLEIRLANDRAEVARAVEQVERFLRHAGADRAVVLRASLSLDELLTNIVTYGYPDGPPGEIEVRAAIAGDRVRIAIEDDGRPFNPLDHPAPDLDSALERREAGGFGIHLVRESMDRIAYRRAGGRNLLTMQCCLRDETARAGRVAGDG